MVGQNSPADWLPAGWTVEVRVRKNGKKDKYYFDPSNGHKFDSKPEVLRYLKSIEINNSTPKRRRRQIGNQSAINSSAVAEQQKLGESGENRQICNNESSKLSGVEKDEQNFRSTCTGDCMPLSEQCMEEARMSNAKTLEDKDLNPLSLHSSAHFVGDFPENLPSENGVKKSEDDRKTQLGLNKLCQKKEPSLPRRASKRLAGVQADPEAELKYNSPARGVAARKSNETKASSGERYGNLNTTEERTGKSERENEIDEKPSNTLVLSPNNPSIQNVLSPNNPSIPEEHSRKIETECKADEKPLNPLIMPPKNPKNTLLPTPNNPSIPEEHSRKIETECKADEKPSTPEEHHIKADENIRSSGDLWTDPCIEFAIKTLTGTISLEDEIKVDENPMPFQGLTFGDSWTDPCIEFAVKTLTGEIPVGDDLGIQDYIQGQLSSSENGGNKGLTLPNDALNHFCQTNLVCQHFDAMEKPTLTPSGSFDLKNSGISGDAQREKCYRERVL